MFRRLLPALFALLIALAPAQAQFGGGRYPGGGGRSGRGNGRGQGQRASADAQVHGTPETLTGKVRELNGTDLVITADEDAAILIQIQKSTRYLSTMGKVKAADFEPGDHVTVEAIRDDNDHYYSKTITLNKKGTPEERAAAVAATSSSSGSGSSSGDSDPDRPRLRRADSVNSPEASASEPQAPAPRAAQPADVASASTQTARRRPAVSESGSAPAAVSSAPIGDDSGPPVLRRSAPASNDSAPAARPTLSAEDANGVTRLPVISETANSRPPQPAASDDSVIDSAREAAFSFTQSLPNYVVKQNTSRYQSLSGGRSWQPVDIVTTDLVYEDGKERYTNTLVNGKATKSVDQTGSWSEGEFGSMLQAILSPVTNADFQNKRSTTIANRTAWRYDYSVEQSRSTWSLHSEGQTYSSGYTGAIWIDKETSRVLRMEVAARSIPRNFPMDTAESSVDYDFVSIGTQKVLLPVHSESLSCTRGTPDCSKNATDFRNYRKYGADSSISFDPAGK